MRSRLFYFLLAFALLTGSFGFKKPALALGSCLCTSATNAECRDVDPSACGSEGVNGFSCMPMSDSDACDKAAQDQRAQILNSTSGGQTAQNQGVTGKFLPACATADQWDPSTECGDISIFLILMFNIVNYLFGIIGAVALLYFVYGGFVFILSQGAPDKIKHGKEIIFTAVLGIVVAFSGYAIVSFVGSVVGIKSEYRLQ